MKAKRLRYFLVVGPETVRYDYSGYDPPEYGCDCVEIEAYNKRDAIILGVQEILRTQKRSVAEDNRGDGLPPWAGYRAEEYD